jgi:hypothetical protein
LVTLFYIFFLLFSDPFTPAFVVTPASQNNLDYSFYHSVTLNAAGSTGPHPLTYTYYVYDTFGNVTVLASDVTGSITYTFPMGGSYTFGVTVNDNCWTQNLNASATLVCAYDTSYSVDIVPTTSNYNALSGWDLITVYGVVVPNASPPIAVSLAYTVNIYDPDGVIVANVSSSSAVFPYTPTKAGIHNAIVTFFDGCQRTILSKTFTADCPALPTIAISHSPTTIKYLTILIIFSHCKLRWSYVTRCHHIYQ